VTARKKQDESAAEEPKFEEGMAQLEDMVRRLETGSIPLEESLETFEKGVSLVRVLQAKLDAVQEKIEELTRTERGGLTTQTIDTEAE
jgi:exodeoxyribonuclease VII small subunit